jgi:hypothetical protein
VRIKIFDGSNTSEFRAKEYIDNRYALVSFNTGNLLFLHALKQHIPEAVAAPNNEAFMDDTDVAVLALANFINPHAKMASATQILRESRVSRIILVSCGAQAASYDDQFDLRPDTRDFLSLVTERSTSIGVRGVYTAELLLRNGIKNIRIIGCPSLYISGAEPPRIRTIPKPQKIAIGVTLSEQFGDKIKDLYAFAMRAEATYVLQSEEPLLGLFTDQPTTRHRERLDLFLKYRCPPGAERDHFAEWLRAHAKMFFDVGEWIDHMREYDLYISGRIHGTVAALHAGCPALTLVQDSRTRELCEYFHLPFIDLWSFDGSLPPEHYAALVDYTNFYATYPSRLAEYLAFMAENGISVSSLAGGAQTKISEHTEMPDLGHLPIGRATRARTAIRSIEDARIGPAFSALKAALGQERVP